MKTTITENADSGLRLTTCSRNLTPAQREVMRVLREEPNARIMGDYIAKRWTLIYAAGGLSPTRTVRDALVKVLIDGGHIVRTADYHGRRVYIENAIGHPAATTKAGTQQRTLSPSDGPTC